MNAAENTERRSGRPLVLIFLLLAAGILTSGYIYYRSYQRQFRSEVEHELSTVTELQVAQIVQWRRERLTDANYLQHTPYAARRSLDVLALPGSVSTRKTFTSWLDSLLAGGSYEQVLLLDDQLKLGLAYPGRTPAALSELALRAAREALNLKQVVVADLHRETEDGPVYLSIMVPLVVRRESNGDKVPAAGTGSLPGDRSAALLILQINADKEFYPLIQHWPTPRRTAETLLVRRDGNDVLFLNELKFQTNTALKFRVPLERTNVIAVKTALGQEGIVEGRDHRGVPMVAALRAIPDSPWSMACPMQLAEVYAPVRKRLWEVVFLIGVLLFAAGAGVGLVWRQQRLRLYQARLAAAAELQESEDRFAGAFEHAPIGVALVSPQGRWLKANRALCDLVGYSEAALQTRTIMDLTHPADVELSRESVRRVLAGESVALQVEKRYLHARGNVITALLNISLVRDGQGQPRYFVAQIQDITERKRTQQVIERGLQRLTEAQRIGQIGDWEHDLATQAVTWSPQVFEIFGRDPRLGPPRNYEETAALFDAASQALMKEKVTLAIESGEAQDYELRAHRPNGTPVDVLGRAMPRKDESGKVVGLVGTVQDITARKRSEEALRVSDERLRAALAASGTGTFRWNLRTNEVSWDDSLDALFGLPPGRTVRSLEAFITAVHPDDRPGVIERCERCAREGADFAMEFRVLWPDGSLHWLDDRGKTFSDAAGEPLYMTGACVDITARKQGEEAVQRSEKRLRDLIDGVGPSMFVGLLTPQGILIECNRPALAAGGLKPEDVLGKPFDQTPWWSHLPEAQQQLREAMARAAQGEASRYDMRTQGPGNQIIDVDFSLQPLWNEAGEVVFLVPSACVITERKQAETALRASEANMTIAQRIAHLGSWELELSDSKDVHANTLRWSDEMFRIAGYEPGAVKVSNESFFRLVHPDDRDPVRQAVAAAIRERRQYSIVHRLIRPDGEERVLQETAQIFFDEKTGQPFKIVGTTLDITERKRAEVSLEKAHQELVAASRQAGMAEMATGVLHNVGNVLNSVNVASGCMADSLKKSKAGNLSKVVTMLREHEADLGVFITNDAKGRKIPAYLAQLAEHLADEHVALLNELAQLQMNIQHVKEVVTAQQSSAKMAGQSETFQVVDLVEDTLRMDSGGQASRNIQVNKQFEAAPLIKVEKHKVLQILMNLVRNAKHSCQESDRADKQLTLRVTNGEHRVRIAVSDNGVGISPENLARIFAHGFTTKKDGHGFGLHSAVAAAKEMGGSLNVQSDGVGHGATFTLELPAKANSDS